VLPTPTSVDGAEQAPTDDPTPVTSGATGPVILVVDDDPLLGRVVEATLDFEGATVRTAHSLAEARDELKPDIDHVVLDRRLPDGDGLELVDELKRACPAARIIVFSAYDLDGGPVDLPRVPKSDVATLVALLGLERPGHQPPAPI
jgi:CheY-like chemotaxis protein